MGGVCVGRGWIFLSRGRFQFLFLGLQHGRQRNLKGCPERRERTLLRAQDLSRGAGHTASGGTYSQVVQMGLKLQNTVNVTNKQDIERSAPLFSDHRHPRNTQKETSVLELTRQAHRTDVANFDEVSVTEASGPVIHVNRGWEG